jgi:hypothetical protein
MGNIFDSINDDIADALYQRFQQENERNIQAGRPFFVLVDGKIKPASHAMWFEDIVNRRIDYTDLTNFDKYPGGSYVSTVFLGIDHGFGRKSLPVLFETMVFGGEYDNYQFRYCTLEEAQVGHQIVVNNLRSGLEPDIPNRDDPRWIKAFFEMYTGDV